jgi:predicted acyltransferase
LHQKLYNGYFAPIASPMNASLLWALSFVALMYLLAWFMYRRRWFLRV